MDEIKNEIIFNKDLSLKILKKYKKCYCTKKLKPLPFILISRESDGMFIVKKRNANNYKKLEMCWNEKL